MINTAIRLFPLWAILLSALAYAVPSLFIPLKPSLFFLLGLVMFGMGISLKTADFSRVFKQPKAIAIGLLLQFIFMPLYAWGISNWLELPILIGVGMILVGASPGGTASNVICYLAKGDVALSITLTTFSTLLAVIATPALTLLLVGKDVDVPAQKMLLDVLKIVILPVLAGLAINTFFGRFLAAAQRIFPLVSVMSIVLIIAIIVALNHSRLGNIGLALVLAVACHNALGLLTGYWVPKLFGLNTKTCKTIAIEVGMQNSGLAVALATKYFAASAALPGALFSLWHNLTGSALAAYFSKKG